MIVVSATTDGWVSDLLLNLGASVLLIVPILVVSLRLEREIEASERRTKQETAAIRAKVDAVEADSRRSLEEIRSSFSAMQAARQSTEIGTVEDLVDAPGFESMQKALDFYTANGTISKTGIRFKLGYPDIWVGLRPLGSGIEARIQRKDGEQLFDCTWYGSANPEGFVDTIASRLATSGNYVPDGLDPAQLFMGVKALLFTARATRIERAGDDLGPVRQICPPQWLMYDNGIGTSAGEDPYFIAYSRLHQVNWRQQVGDKPWADYASLDEAISQAEDLSLGKPFTGYPDRPWSVNERNHG